MSIRQVTLDTETTGREVSEGHRIVEIGCVEIIGRSLSDRDSAFFHAYCNPGMDMDEAVIAVHGITNDFARKQPPFADIAKKFLEFVKGSELIIHNAAFDVGFLNMELGRAGMGRIEDYCPKITDSLELARSIYPGLRNSLDALCTRLSIDRSIRADHHGALIDAGLLAQVYLAMTRSQGSMLEKMLEGFIPHKSMPDNSRLVRAAATDAELALHEEFLKMVDRKCPEGSLWHRAGPSEQETAGS